MIDFRQTDNLMEPAPDSAPRWLTRRVWPFVVVGLLMVGLFPVWRGGLFKVKPPDGIIVLEKVPKDSEILVDGIKIAFAWPGGGKPVEIRAVPGQHRIEVNGDRLRPFSSANSAGLLISSNLGPGSPGRGRR